MSRTIALYNRLCDLIDIEDPHLCSRASDVLLSLLDHYADPDLCVWAFDLLYVNGRDLRQQPLLKRKQMLQRLVNKTNANWLRYSESFDDGVALLRAADRMELEGIVSKKADAPYRSGKRSDWIKVKSLSWRVVNRERWRLFEQR